MRRKPLLSKYILQTICVVLFASGFCDAADFALEKCWTYPVTDGAASVADAEHIFIASTGGEIEGISTEGKKIWSTDLGGEISSNLWISDGAVYVVTSSRDGGALSYNNSILRSLSAETGITSWSVRVPASQKVFLRVVDGRMIVVSDLGTVQAIDTKTGTPYWKREIGSRLVGVPFIQKSILAATADLQLYSITAATGEIESTRKTLFPVSALTLGQQGELIAGDERGGLTLWLAGVDKSEWTFRSGGRISSLEPAGDRVLMTSYDNFVYFITTASGGVAWKKRFGGRVSLVELLNENLAMVSVVDEHGAVFCDLKTGRPVGQVLFPDDEILVDTAAAKDTLLLLTNRTAYGYSLGSCAKNGVQGSLPKNAVQK